MSISQRDILDWVGSNPTMARTLSAASKLDQVGGDTRVRIAIARNITLEPGLPAAIKLRAAQNNLSAIVELGQFDAVQEEVFAPDSFLYREPADIIVVALYLQTLAPRLFSQFAALSADQIDDITEATLERVQSMITAIREQSAALILVHNFGLPIGPAFGVLDTQFPHGQLNTIRMLNMELRRRIAGVQSAYVIDVDYLSSQMGYETALDERYWNIGRAPYSFIFSQVLANEYVKFAAALKGKNKKCVVLDCDNTLWGGVVGEDGINGIALGESHPGSAYVEFQAAILNLYERGVLLAINSKNNVADVIEVLERHPNCLLRPEHFVAMKINWQDKATNLRAIAADLNIGLDSLVFIDDNPFECQHIRETLPEVATIELPTDVTRYARLIRTSGLFDTLAISDEDRRRSEMYRSEARRSELKQVAGSMDDYLRSLGMTLTISLATPFSVPRIAQLTQKTNQFNLTTRRYSEGDIERMVGDPARRVYYAELEDKFDRAGIIAVALVHDTEETSRIDTLLMSCRVIGRGVERAFLAEIARASHSIGQRELVGEFVATAKNEIVSDFYSSMGFGERPNTARQFWALDLKGSLPVTPDWFKLVRADDLLVGI